MVMPTSRSVKTPITIRFIECDLRLRHPPLIASVTSKPEEIVRAPGTLRFASSRRVACLVVILACRNLFGDPFLVSGYFELVHLDDSGRPRFERGMKYQVEVDPEKHLWRIDDLANPPRKVFSFNDFVLSQNSFQDLNKLQFEPSYYHNGNPIDLDGDERLLWFVYCARDYLQKRNGAQVTLPHGDARLRVALNSSRALISWRKTNDCSPENRRVSCTRASFLEESIQLLTLVPPSEKV